MSPQPPWPIIFPSLQSFFSLSVRMKPSGSGLGSALFLGGAMTTENVSESICKKKEQQLYIFIDMGGNANQVNVTFCDLKPLRQNYLTLKIGIAMYHNTHVNGKQLLLIWRKCVSSLCRGLHSGYIFNPWPVGFHGIKTVFLINHWKQYKRGDKQFISEHFVSGLYPTSCIKAWTVHNHHLWCLKAYIVRYKIHIFMFIKI